MTWIEPFELQTWFVNVFSGNPNIFFAVSMIAIIGMAAYFRMTQLTMFFMIGIFTIMFAGLDVIPIGMSTLIKLITALVVGYVIHKMYNRQ